MKAKFAVSLLALSIASTSALAAVAQSDFNRGTHHGDNHASQHTGFLYKQFERLNNTLNVHASGANTNWFNRISISGLLNLDVWGQTNRNFLQPRIANSSNHGVMGVAVGSALLNFGIHVNDFINGRVGLLYASDKQPNGISGVVGGDSKFHPTRYYPLHNVKSANVDQVVDQAYVDIGNFERAPVMLRVGKAYAPFGQYNRYAMMPTLTQQLSETRANLGELAFVHNSGLHGAVYAFSGLKKANKSANNITNGGATIGYSNSYNKVGFNINAGYLYNMADVGTIAQQLPRYTKRIGAWTAHADAVTGPWKLGFDYVAAIGGFKTKDLTWYDDKGKSSASPKAGNIFGSYVFKSYGYDSKVTVSYQWSNEAFAGHEGSAGELTSGLVLPKQRIAAEYDINIWKNTMLGLELNRDKAYAVKHGGTGDHSYTGIVRLSVLL